MGTSRRLKIYLFSSTNLATDGRGGGSPRVPDEMKSLASAGYEAKAIGLEPGNGPPSREDYCGSAVLIWRWLEE
jgi:hypothetical protein